MADSNDLQPLIERDQIVIPSQQLREWIAVALCVLVNLGAHVLTVIDGMGELDQGRLIINAAYWHFTGSAYSDLFRVCPLYLHFIKKMIDWGRNIDSIPNMLNAINMIVGPLALVPLYLFWRRLANHHVAFSAILLVSVYPAFFGACNYGFPHLIALFWFASALWCFAMSFAAQGRQQALWLAATLLLMMLACGFKADIVMLSGAFLGVAIQQKADKWGLLRGCLVGPIAILFPILYSRAYAPARASSVSFGTDFVQKYTHLKSLINYGQIKPIFLTPGPVLFAAGILAFVYVAIRYRAYWRLAALGFLWVAPATVWWLTVNGNSARHNMSPLIGLAFFIGLAIFGNGKARLWKYGVLCALIVANYFSWPNSDMTWLPSTRLLSSAWLTQDRTTFVGQRALDFVYADGDKKMVIGEGSGVVAAMACLGAAKKIDYTSDRYNFALTMPWAITPRRQAIDMIKVTSPQEATIKMNYMKTHGVKNFFSLEYMLDQ